MWRHCHRSEPSFDSLKARCSAIYMQPHRLDFVK